MTGKEVEIVSILGSSQGVISVVSALLAGASGTMLTSVGEEALVRAGLVSYLFIISASLGTAMNLGTAIICIISEQESKVALAFSLLHESVEFDKSVEQWWREFAVLRTQALMCFLYSVPLTFFTMACQCYIINHNLIGATGFVVFVIIGGFVSRNLFGMNDLFREKVLRLTNKHSAPVYFTQSKTVLGAASNHEVQAMSRPLKSSPRSPAGPADATSRRRSLRKANTDSFN